MASVDVEESAVSNVFLLGELNEGVKVIISGFMIFP